MNRKRAETKTYEHVIRSLSPLSGSIRKVVRLWIVFFFFQAEDGIRDYKVTGVQTCALPICCGDFVRIGAAGATDLTDTLNAPNPGVFGANRRRGAVAWIARAAQNTTTMWADRKSVV